MTMLPMGGGDPDLGFGPMPEIFTHQLDLSGLGQPKRGMFGGINIKNVLIGALGGYLASRGNPAGVLALRGMMDAREAKHQQAQRDDEYQRKRSDDRADFTFENQWKLDHPAAPNNDTIADYDFITKTLGPEAGKQFLQSKTNPVVMTPYGPMPYSSVMGSSQEPQVIQALPPGAKPLGAGGPTPQASGGFPGY